MLRDLTESATALPFSAGGTGAGRYEVSTALVLTLIVATFLILIVAGQRPARRSLAFRPAWSLSRPRRPFSPES